MPTNETRLELLKRVKASGYPGSITEVFQASDQGIDLVEQHQLQQQQQQMQVANTPQQQEVGLREQHAMGNTQASMAFPDVQPNQSFNTVGMEAPIDIQKIDDQGHLVESYKNVPPGIQDLPTGPSEGTVIESPAAYQKGGFKKYQKGGVQNNTSYEKAHKIFKLQYELDSDYSFLKRRADDKDPKWDEHRIIFNKAIDRKLKELSTLTNKPYVYIGDLPEEEWDDYTKHRKPPKYDYEDARFNKRGDGLTWDELDKRYEYNWYEQNKDKKNYGYRSLTQFKRDYPEDYLYYMDNKDGSQTWGLSGETGAMHPIEFTTPPKRKKEKLLKIPPIGIQSLSTSNEEHPIKAHPYELIKTKSPHYTIERAGIATHTYPKGDDGKALVVLKDSAGRRIFKGSQTEYTEKYGEHLERGTTEYGERKKSRLYLKNTYQKGGLRKYQNGGWDNFEKSKVGKFIDAKGLRQEKDFWMEQFGYEPGKEEKDAVLDAAAIVNPVPDFIHAATKAQEGKYTDAALYAGFGIFPFAAGPLVKGTKKHIINPIKNLFKSKPKFKSDIDWSKFNKEIPGNTALMDEYKHIEDITKSRGTWMKNADGSKFKGTPEQFVQQKSRNFNVNMPNIVKDASGNVKVNYHGSGSKFDTFDKSKFKSGVYGEGVYTSTDKEAILKSYANPTKGRTQGLAQRSGQKPTENLYELYINSNRTVSPDEISDFRNWGKRVEDLSSLKEWKSSEFGKKILKEYKHLKTDDDIISFIKQNNINPVKESLLPESMIGDFMKVDNLHGTPEQVTPYWNYMKSAKGNSGMFDMTNPNIYKQKGGFKSKYQTGGERQSPIMMESPIGLQPTQTDIDVKKIRDTYNTDKNPLRADMMTHLDTTGRDTTYVNSVIYHISQHESKGDPIAQQDGGGPGRGMFQYEEGSKKGGNTAINNTMNFLKKYSPTRKNAPHTKDKPFYEMYKGKSADLSKLDKRTQEGIFLGDKIYGGTPQRDAFDKLVKNRETPPTSDEMFEFWGKYHKRVFIYKDKDGEPIKYLWDKLPADKKEIEKKKWQDRTGSSMKSTKSKLGGIRKLKKRGGYKSKYY